jgi:hypothetical protein
MSRQNAIAASYFKERPEFCAFSAMVVVDGLGRHADNCSPVRNTLALALQQSQTNGII